MLPEAALFLVSRSTKASCGGIAMTSPAATLAAPSPSSSESSFRKDIGGLRGLAIILVAIGHIFAPVGVHIIGGVDISFALSGYLLTLIAIREFMRYGRINMRAFYGRRLRRLMPAATLVTLATLVASFIWMPAGRLREIAADGFYSSVSAFNYWLIHTNRDYVAAGEHTEGGVEMTSPFQHYWSLAIEEQFYLLYPALLLLALYYGRKIGRVRLTVGIMLAIVVLASFTASVIQTGDKTTPLAYYSVHTRVWELALGALVAVAQPLFKRLPAIAARSLGWIGLAGIFASVAVIKQYPLPGFYVGAPVIGTLLVIIAGETGRMRFGVESILRFAPLQYVGKISYQWYLWHWPGLIILPAALGIDPKAMTLQHLFMVFVGSFVLASLTWHQLDVPIREAKLNASGAGLYVAMISVGLVAALTAGGLHQISPTASTQSAPDKVGGQVEQLVTEATSIQQLPDKVRKALVGVREWDQRCIVQPEDTNPKACTYGNKTAKKTVYAIGDSHTTHWLPALEVIAKKRGFKLVTHAKSRCTAEPYTNIDYHFKRRYTECEQWRESVYREIETARPQAVIFSSAIYEGASGEATARIVQRFTALGIKVVIFDDTPRPFIHIPDCLEKPSLANVQDCAIPRETAMYMPDLRKARADAATQAGGLFVPMAQWFCTDKVCPPVINGMVVYIDEAHILGAYAVWLAPELEEVISPAL
jgi:peptidoglycan/LPS O-acetylase OafA/YrhL